jgi:hypothetical protein
LSKKSSDKAATFLHLLDVRIKGDEKSLLLAMKMNSAKI